MEFPVLRRLARRLGFDVISWPRIERDLRRRIQLVEGWGIDTVLDVGANVGQYASRMRELGYAGRIISFEPLDAARETLLHASRGDSQWEVRPEALGDREGPGTLYVAGNSVSSSLLPMAPAHLEADPTSAFIAEQDIHVARLDGLWMELDLDAATCMLKIDSQGFEKQILDGCGMQLGTLAAIQFELSLEPMYDGEPRLEEMLGWISARGFRLMSLEPGFHDPRTGRLLQVDGVFERTRD